MLQIPSVTGPIYLIMVTGYMAVRYSSFRNAPGARPC